MTAIFGIFNKKAAVIAADSTEFKLWAKHKLWPAAQSLGPLYKKCLTLNSYG